MSDNQSSTPPGLSAAAADIVIGPADFSDLPMIQCLPQPVPADHPDNHRPGRHSRWEVGEENDRYKAEFAKGMRDLRDLEVAVSRQLTSLEHLR